MIKETEFSSIEAAAINLANDLATILIEAIDSHQQYLNDSGQGPIRRHSGRVARVRNAISTRYGRYGLDRLKGSLEIETFVDARPERSVEGLVDDLGVEVEKALRSSGP